jgi:oligopeptide transport system ATP-binding protein
MTAAAVDDVIVARDVKLHYLARGGWFDRRGAPAIRAVDGVSFAIPRGSCFAIVGESGSGKSTLARVLVGLLRATDGEVRLDGADVAALSDAERRRMRRKVQLVLQDPHASLDPRMTVRQTLREALVVHGLHPDPGARDRRIVEVIRQVGLSVAHLDRYPNALSGGQRQRVAIARGVICEPEVLVLDEPVSALDVSVQAQIINLLMELQAALNLTYVIITHDLSLVSFMADAVGVMYLGRFVECGDAASVCGDPRHPYTESLLAAVAGVDPEFERSRPLALLRGAAPSPAAIPSGCTFHTRCPRARLIGPAMPPAERAIVDGDALPARCVRETPAPRRPVGSDVLATCHFPAEPTGTRAAARGGSSTQRI